MTCCGHAIKDAAKLEKTALGWEWCLAHPG